MPLRRFVLAAAALAFTAPVWALPATTVQWVQREGTTSGADVVEVWLRLTVTQLDAGPLYLDGSTTSFSAADLSALAGWTTVDFYNGGSADCALEFFPQPPGLNCESPTSAWKFAFNDDPATSFSQSQATPLLPGQSKDYLLATFTPQNGPVAPGVYTFRNAGLLIAAVGTDQTGAFAYHPYLLGSTCSDGSPTCVFTRTVTGVPEPRSSALMALGLFGLAGYAHRRTRARG